MPENFQQCRSRGFRDTTLTKLQKKSFLVATSPFQIVITIMLYKITPTKKLYFSVNLTRDKKKRPS